MREVLPHSPPCHVPYRAISTCTWMYHVHMQDTLLPLSQYVTRVCLERPLLKHMDEMIIYPHLLLSFIVFSNLSLSAHKIPWCRSSPFLPANSPASHLNPLSIRLQVISLSINYGYPKGGARGGFQIGACGFWATHQGSC
jgi:hypothetical protein